MRAMLFKSAGMPLIEADLPQPSPAPREVLLRVRACAVCRTDLHIVDGELAHPKLPLVLGHEIVGEVVTAGAQVERFQPGDQVGVPWLGATCGACAYCCTGPAVPRCWCPAERVPRRPAIQPRGLRPF